MEYIKDKESTSDFTKMIDLLVEKTKENQTFRGDYMAWGLAEQDVEKRGYNAGVAEAKIETAKNMLKYDDSLEKIASVTGFSLEIVQKLAEEQKSSNIKPCEHCKN